MKNIWKISFITSTTYGTLLGLQFFIAIFLFKIGLSGPEVGLLFAIDFFSRTLSILPSGISNDSSKSKNLVSISLLMIALNFYLLAKTENLLILIFAFFLVGVGRSLFAASTDSLFYKTAESENVSEEIGKFHGTQYLLTAAGMILSGFALQRSISFSNIFLIAGTLFVLGSILSQILLPNNACTKFNIIHYKKDLLKPKVLFACLIFFLFFFHVGAEFTSYGPFLKENLKLNDFQAGLYMGLAVLFMAPMAIFTGKNLKKFRAKNILIFALLTSGIGNILSTIPHPIYSFIFRVIHEIGDAGMLFALYYSVSKLFKLERIGGNSGVVRFFNVTSMGIGSLFFGFIAKAYGHNIALIIGGASSLFALILALQYIHHLDHE